MKPKRFKILFKFWNQSYGLWFYFVREGKLTYSLPTYLVTTW